MVTTAIECPVMSELIQWLQNQGLEQLEPTLTANGIEIDVLDELTEQDLASIGLSLGDRKRLLKAIRARAGAAARPSEPARPNLLQQPSAARSAEVDSDSRDAVHRNDGGAKAATSEPGWAERRNLTVMFCDLVDSTRLADELDPEDTSDFLRLYHDQARAAIAEFGGRVAQFLGDGVLCYFGYPVQHEDDAERAVHSAFDLMQRLAAARLKGGRVLVARFGIASGMVVMHEMMNVEGWNSDSAVGRTINLAARLQAEAEPGGIVVDDSVQHALGSAFRLRSLGTRNLKGFSKPLELWRVEPGGATASRFDATRHRDTGPMVGRAEELRALRNRWREATEGRGSSVVLTADAGIGKSRLLYELSSSIHEGHTFFAQAVSYSNATPYLPLAEALRRFAAFGADDTSEERRTKLDSLAESMGFTELRLLSALRHLLGLAGVDDEIAKVSAEVRQARIFESLRTWFFVLSRQAPLLLIVEDLHWSDRATEALLATLVNDLAESRILFVSTHRPEHRVQWLGLPGVMQLMLSPLTRQESEQLLGRLLGDRADDEAFRRSMVTRAQGNPLFMEELARSGEPTAAGDELPQTVQALLMARIDALPKKLRRALQTASVLGREFRRKVFQTVWEKTDLLGDLILEMEQQQLLQERLERDDSVLTFRHALVQDAAYGTLVRARRRELHISAAQAIESLSTGDRLETAAVLAHHYVGAEQPLPAIGFLLTLADSAMAAYALADAQASLKKAATLTDLIDDRDRARELRYKVKLRLAQVLYMQGHFQESIDLLEVDLPALLESSVPELSAPCLFWLGHMYVRRARYEDAKLVCLAAIDQAAAVDDAATRGKALGVLCLRACLRGESRESEAAGRQSIVFLEERGETYWLAMSRFYLGMLYVQTGECEAACREGTLVIDKGRNLGDPRLQSYGLFLRGWALADASNAGAIGEAERAVIMAPDPTSRAYTTGFLAYAYLRTGDLAEAIKRLQEAVISVERIGFRPFESLFLAYLAEAQRLLGDAAAAKRSAERAIKAAEAWAYPLGEAWARRALGRIADGAGPAADREASLQSAERIFQAIDARHELGRTATF
jgi:class 3 adenylate cyclase/tetratricopeptide (TPR) repeat protein